MSSLIPLKRLFRIYNGSTPKSSEPDYWDGNIHWATPEDLGRLKVPYLSNTSRKITQEGYENCGATIVPSGSLIITSRAPVGNLAISGVDMCTNQGCKSLEQIRADRTSPKFYYYYLISQKESLQSIARGSTFFEINADELGAFKVVSYELKTQTKIANYLDRKTVELDQLIMAKQRLLKLLDEKKRALIAHAVTRGLNPDVPLKNSGIPWLDMVPAHWEIERARWLFVQSDLPVRKEDEMVTCFRDGIVTLRRNRREVGFTNAVLELGYQGIRKGQLVLHSMDAFAGAIGVSDSNGKCTPEYVICDPTTDKTDSNYYGLLLREMALQNFIQAYCSAVRERAPRIRFNQFKDFELPVPPIEEQNSIVKHIKQAMQSLEQLQEITKKTITLLQERRTALISAAVTGKLSQEVQNAS